MVIFRIGYRLLFLRQVRPGGRLPLSNRETQHPYFLLRRLAWFVALWAVGVVVVGVAARLIRLALC